MDGGSKSIQVNQNPGTGADGLRGVGYPSPSSPQYGEPAYPIPSAERGYSPTSQYPQAYPGQPYPPQGFAQPAGGPPPRKKSKAPLIIGIFAAIVLVGCGGIVALAASSDNDAPTTQNAGASGDEPTAAAKPKEAAKPKVAGLNKAVRDGKFEFVVKTVKCGKTTVGGSYLNKKAQGQFCEVRISVKNIGKEPQIFSGSFQKAMGSKGAEYSNDGAAELYANSENETFLNEINPGNKAQGVLIFDIPKGSKIASLELHDSPFSEGVTVKVS